MMLQRVLTLSFRGFSCAARHLHQSHTTARRVAALFSLHKAAALKPRCFLHSEAAPSDCGFFTSPPLSFSSALFDHFFSLSVNLKKKLHDQPEEKAQSAHRRCRCHIGIGLHVLTLPFSSSLFSNTMQFCHQKVFFSSFKVVTKTLSSFPRATLKEQNDSEGWQPPCLQPQTAIITSRLAQ